MVKMDNSHSVRETSVVHTCTKANITPSLPDRNARPLALFEDFGDLWISRLQRLEQELTDGKPKTARKRGGEDTKRRRKYQAGVLAVTRRRRRLGPCGAPRTHTWRHSCPRRTFSGTVLGTRTQNEFDIQLLPLLPLTVS